AHKRESLLNATTKVLEGIQKTVSRGRITGKAEIGVRIVLLIPQRMRGDLIVVGAPAADV
ncbi:MAG TPA: hypothetical protein VF858_09795, partial [Gemmatimonadaceae bacterium]